MSSHQEVASTRWSMRDSGKSSFGDALLRSVKSAHMRHLPVALRTRTGLARHSGCFTSCMPLLLAASLSPPLLPPVCWHATELLHLGGGGCLAFDGEATLDGFSGHPEDVFGAPCDDVFVVVEDPENVCPGLGSDVCSQCRYFLGGSFLQGHP